MGYKGESDCQIRIEDLLELQGRRLRLFDRTNRCEQRGNQRVFLQWRGKKVLWQSSDRQMLCVLTRVNQGCQSKVPEMWQRLRAQVQLQYYYQNGFWWYWYHCQKV